MISISEAEDGFQGSERFPEGLVRRTKQDEFHRKIPRGTLRFTLPSDTSTLYCTYCTLYSPELLQGAAF